MLSVLKNVPLFIYKVEKRGSEYFIFVKKPFFIKLVSFLYLHTFCQMKQLVDLCVIDNPSTFRRFTLVYSLLSFSWNMRINLIFSVSEVEIVPSLTSIYSSANWAEREAYDLYGVFFSGHPDLRRILTDYGFEGFPMRKDFPLTGYLEVRFDDEQKRVLYEPLELAQEFRAFDFTSPWVK